MSALWIKVCGMTSFDAVAAAIEAGADAIGFVFHAGSPRNVTPERAAQLAARVPSSVARVAVFMHPSQQALDAVLATLAPDLVQTDADDFSSLRVPASQATLPVLRSGAALPRALPERFVYESAASGTGRVADWDEARALAARGRLVLGGGLTPENVAAAVRRVAPHGVDVSSGVERERGIKDPRRIVDFVAAARAAHATGVHA